MILEAELKYRTFLAGGPGSGVYDHHRFTDGKATDSVLTAPLTAEQRKAVSLFQQMGHYLNAYLRGDKSEKNYFNRVNPSQTIEDLDAAISKSSLTKSIFLYRGVTGNYADDLSKLKPGAKISQEGYQSTSTSAHFASAWADKGVVLKISAPAGSKALNVGGNLASESELLLPRNSSMRVTKIEQITNPYTKTQSTLLHVDLE